MRRTRRGCSKSNEEREAVQVVLTYSWLAEVNVISASLIDIRMVCNMYMVFLANQERPLGLSVI